MSHYRRTLSAALFSLLAFVSGSIQAQGSSIYTVSAGKSEITFVAHPELGYVSQSNQSEPATEAFGGMVSSEDNIGEREVKGLVKRNLSVVLNNLPDGPRIDAFEKLQSKTKVGYTAPLFSVNDQTVAVIPEIVVRLAFKEAYENLNSFCSKHNLTIKKKLEFTQKEYLISLNGTDAESVFTAVDLLKREHYVEWAAPNIASQPMLQEFIVSDGNSVEPNMPNDEYFSTLWHLYNTGQTGGTPGADINAPRAWEVTEGDPNIIIAVLDTGVDINHPDLLKNLVPGYDFVDDDNVPAPSLENPMDAHGTMCAGLAAGRGNNEIGVCGAAWKCKIMPIKVADDEYFVTDADIATAFRWAAQHGADVLSNSWGSFYPSQIIYSAIIDVTERNGLGRDGKGCVVFASAGNWEDGGPVCYPAARQEVISIGATDHDDRVWYYSASGPELDLVAPSGAMTRIDHFFLGKPYLWTTDITGIYGFSIENIDTTMWDYSDSMRGTSGSCPIAAGVAALVLSVDPNLTNIEVRRILLDTAVDLGEPGKDDYYGFGRVDANAAVHLALNPPAIPPTSYITLYVDDNAPDDPCVGNPDFSDPNEDGTSLHPFDSIQKAINNTLSSETIIVLPGTYTGEGNHDLDLMGKPLKIQSETGPEGCLIDCQDSGRGFYLHSGESEEALIEGFTIVNGRAYDGAGIYCTNGSSPTIRDCVISSCWAYSWGELGGEGGGILIDSGCNPTLTNCTLNENLASWYGGGIRNNYGDPVLDNCTFNKNMAGYEGGGIYNFAGNPTLTDCNFLENSAQSEGGGIYNEEGYPTVTNCLFSSNEAIEYAGGGISNYYGDAIMSDCSFINNSTGGWGAGISNADGYGTLLTNCIFSGNNASYGGALYSEESLLVITNCTFASNSADNGNAIACDYSWFGSDITISNSIIWDGTSSIWNNDYSTIGVSYSDVKRSGSNTWQGVGNINKDPEFAEPGNGDFHLKSHAGRWEPSSQTWVQDDVNSPCIDAGAPDSDYSKEPQPNGGRINMGYYGGTAEASLSYSSGQTPPPAPPPASSSKASNPNPPDTSFWGEPSVTLSWTAGANAVKHDIYFGTDANSVNNANRAAPMDVLKSQGQTETNFNPAILDDFQFYCWRVDEILPDNSIIKGDIWSFITMFEGSKGRGCFTGQVPVWINGKEIEISKAAAGQCVGVSPGGNAVNRVLEHEGTFDLVDIVLDDGDCITVANEHYFMAESGRWMSSKNLVAGMKLCTASGTTRIKTITKRREQFTGKVYNLQIKDSEKYMVGKDAVIVRDY